VQVESDAALATAAVGVAAAAAATLVVDAGEHGDGDSWVVR
jgi:hypothetical protein